MSCGSVRLPPVMVLERGGFLRQGELAYRSYGSPRHPSVLVLGGISSGRQLTASPDNLHETGWWPDIVGAGRAVDTGRFHVLGVDYLGGNGASTRPDGGPANENFAAVTTLDQARAIEALLDHLGIPRLHAIVGSSYGGMVALAFTALSGSRVGHAVVMGAADEAHPMATALRSLQRRVVRLGLATGAQGEALRIAREIAVTTYRSAEEFALRFDTAARPGAGRPRFAVEEYLAHCGQRFSETFAPASFLCLSESIDLHRIDPATISVPMTLVTCASDVLVPPWLMQRLRDQLAGPAELLTLESIYGHDAFLKEAEAVSAILSRTFAQLEDA